jgi:pyrroline-5-carboxylate reductase
MASGSLDKRIGFLGSGQMAEALARGLMKRGLITADRISCNDPNPARTELFKSFGASPYKSNAEVGRSPTLLTSAPAHSQTSSAQLPTPILRVHLEATLRVEGIKNCRCDPQVARHSDVLFVAVKPQHVSQVRASSLQPSNSSAAPCGAQPHSSSLSCDHPTPRATGAAGGPARAD